MTPVSVVENTLLFLITLVVLQGHYRSQIRTGNLKFSILTLKFPGLTLAVLDAQGHPAISRRLHSVWTIYLFK